jgi:16S rRNA (guanine527-N7)-methyltransferase
VIPGAAGQTQAGVAALARRYGLYEAAVVQLETLLGLLIGDPRAPTAVRDPLRALDDHLADALVALDLDRVRAAPVVADLGSGVGVPGLPLAIALPATHFFLVESGARKCAFLRRAVAACGIANGEVVHARAESWTAGLGRCDLVTARALAPLPVVVEYAAPLLRNGGSLLVWRGRRELEAEAAGARAAAELGLEPGDPMPVHPYAGAEHRYLHLMLKVKDTPPGFPRREGMASKRPLGVPRSASLPSARRDVAAADRGGGHDRGPSDRARR